MELLLLICIFIKLSSFEAHLYKGSIIFLLLTVIFTLCISNISLVIANLNPCPAISRERDLLLDKVNDR